MSNFHIFPLLLCGFIVGGAQAEFNTDWRKHKEIEKLQRQQSYEGMRLEREQRLRQWIKQQERNEHLE